MRDHARNILLITVLFALTVFAGSASAELRVGFVNIAKVMEEAPQAEEARRKLENEFAPRDQKLVDAQRELKQLEDRLATDAAIMSEAERMKLERDIIARKREIKRAREEFREDLNLRRNDELSKLQRLVNEAITGLASRENYDIIMGPSVLYGSQRVDITDKVLRRLREDYKRSAQPGPAPAGKGR